MMSAVRTNPCSADVAERGALKSIVDTTIQVILDVLNDERTDRSSIEVVREPRDQIRRSVRLGLHESEPEPPAEPSSRRAQRQQE